MLEMQIVISNLYIKKTYLKSDPVVFDMSLAIFNLTRILQSGPVFNLILVVFNLTLRHFFHYLIIFI